MIAEDQVKRKVDYRILEVQQASPETEIRVIIVTNVPPSEPILAELTSAHLKVVKVFPDFYSVKVEGRAKHVMAVSSRDFVKYLILDEILVRGAEL
ncbi:hypothetical protein HS1genome_0255 [Sulfodiicoccus acidiphilus]|uniref:Uncharacterized protein n=1 Tax=Sulfodiicoccus acidiphilus TaxID=1670455 RepID=A0A348B114_9CREN|nr:hypothetical protein [Sulfodiicoccus acidiphilus]BBD71866.1 hypothetical protein HS1genome_0255 [Sulfodiicoccus acidiphilus]GGT91074.1 hypothetical protein GCM10007116_05970 [Sulfodiicoccus acidiphilus]